MTEQWRLVADTAKGWLFPAEAEALHRWASEVADLGPLVEIGGYCGKSACWIGSAARDNGTVLFSVDHHRGSPEMAPGKECHDPDVAFLGVHDTLPHFRGNVARALLEDAVIPVVGRSQTVGAYWATPIGFVFIDGGHDTDTVTSDYKLWSPHVLPGGVLAFHDATDRNIGPVVEQAQRDGWQLAEAVESLRVLRR